MPYAFAQPVVDRYEPRPQDLPTEQFAWRVVACGKCPRRHGEACILKNQLVAILARRPAGECPEGRWPAGNSGASSRKS